MEFSLAHYLPVVRLSYHQISFFPRSYSYYNRNKRFELIKLLENQELLNECGIYFCTGIYFFKLAIDTEFFKIGPSAPRRNFFHHKSYSFLSRTVRLTNSNPKALLLGCRGTLAQNRGYNGGVQIPFSFPKSLDFKPLQTKVRILPWQTMSTLILSCISSFFLVYPYFS